MRKSCLVISAVGLSLLLCAGGASGALINYWSCDTANDTGTGLGDSIGGYTATPAGGSTTNPPLRVAGATGIADSGVKTYGPTGGPASGFVTTLRSFGSIFTYEMVFRWDANAYNWNYLTNRAGDPVSLSQQVSSKKLTMTIGTTAILTTTTGPTWNPTAGSWWYLAVVCDGTTASLYLVPQGTTLTGAAGSAAFSGSSTVAAGGHGIGNPDGSRYGLNGAVDWEAVSNTALSLTELNTHNTSNSPVPEPTTMGVLALGGLSMLIRRRRSR